MGKWDDEPVAPKSKWDEEPTKAPEIKIDEVGTRPFTSIGARTAISFASNPDDAVNYLNQNYGKDSKDPLKKTIEFSKHGTLDRLIWRDSSGKTADGKPDTGWHYVDPNVGGGVGEYVADVAELASDVLPMGLGALGAAGAGALGLPSGPGAIATSAIGAGAGSGAGEAGNRAIARWIGVTPKDRPISEDAGQVGMATVLGGAGEAGMEMAKPLLKKGVRNLANKVPDVVLDAPQKAQQALTSLGLKSTKNAQGIVTNVEQKLPEWLRNLPTSSVAKAPFDYVRSIKNNAQFLEYIANDVRNTLKSVGVTDEKEINDMVKKAVSQYEKVLNEEVKPSNIPQGAEKVLEAIGAPQPAEYRAKMSSRVNQLFDNLEEHLTPPEGMTGPKGSTSIPPKNASRKELEEGLLNVFQEDFDSIKSDVFDKAYGKFDNILSTAPMDPQRATFLNVAVSNVKPQTSEGKKALSQLQKSINSSATIADIIKGKRLLSSEGWFKGSKDNPVAKRELARLYDEYTKAIYGVMQTAAQARPIIKDMKDVDSLYSLFIKSPGKIMDAIKNGKSLGGLDTSKIFDARTNKWFEVIGVSDELNKAFEQTQSIYLRQLLREIRDKVIDDAGNVNVAELKKLANDPTKWGYLSELFDKYVSPGELNLVGDSPALISNMIRFTELGTEAQKPGFSRAFVPQVPTTPIAPFSHMTAKAVGNLTGLSPLIGEAVYKPGNLVARALSRTLGKTPTKKEKK